VRPYFTNLAFKDAKLDANCGIDLHKWCAPREEVNDSTERSSAAQRREAAILLATGLAVGTALSLVSTQAAASLLFGLKPRDPLTLALAAFALR